MQNVQIGNEAQVETWCKRTSLVPVSKVNPGRESRLLLCAVFREISRVKLQIRPSGSRSPLGSSSDPSELHKLLHYLFVNHIGLFGPACDFKQKKKSGYKSSPV